MNTKPHSSNVWFEFYDRCWRRYGRSLAKSSVESWKYLIDQTHWEKDILLHFFALTRYEAEQGEPLVFCKDNPKACVQLVADNLGFKYNFTSHKEKLAEQLGKIGVKLLEVPKGMKMEKQYLRTIHRLSGAVYLKAAKKAAAISSDTWIVNETLSPVISQEVKKYKVDEGDAGGEGLAEDVLGFFRTLRKAYRRYNETPTMASFRKDAPQELSDKMLKAILDTLQPRKNQKEENGGATLDETRPVFLFDDQNRIVLGFRPLQKRYFNVDDSVQTIRFVFKRHHGLDNLNIRFRRHEGSWKATELDIRQVVPLESLLSVRRTEFDEKDHRVGEPQDVTPTVLSDPEASYLLFRRNADATAHVIAPSEPLQRGDHLFAVWLHGQSRMPIQWNAENGEDWRDTEPTENEEFTVPIEAKSLKVGEDEYDVVTAVDQWLNRAAAFGSKTSDGHILNSGSRLFFEKGVFPYSDDFLATDGLRVRYRKADGSVVDFYDGHLREIPDGILWNRGNVAFVNTHTGEAMGSKAVTFLPQIVTSELYNEFDLDTDYTVPISAADERVETTIPRAADGRVVDHVEFLLHGFRFRYPVKRRGILVKVAGSGEDPMPLRSGKWIELAKDDFEAAVFTAVLPNEESTLSVAFSNWISEKKIDGQRFSGNDLIRIDANDTCIGDWCFEFKGTNLGGIRVYCPDETPWNGVSGHPVSWERDDNDLVVKFWIARRWREKSLSLIYLPAHRQDEKPKSVPMVKNETFSSANGRLSAELRFPDFYAQQTDRDNTQRIEWGAGLLCFVAFPIDTNRPSENEKWCAVSSGFFLPRPDDASDPWPLPQEEDRFGLRRAMALCDLDEIDRIMMSQNEDCRNEIRIIEEKAYQSLYSIGKENMRYFHAYYSRCKKADGNGFEPSGYFFMAGWLAQEKMVNKFPFKESDEKWPHLKMAKNYKRMWSPLMTPFSDEDTLYWKHVSKTMLAENGEHVWVTAQTIYGSSMEQEMSQIINDTKNEFAVFIKCQACPPFNPVSDDVSFVKPHKNAFWDEKETELDTCLSYLAKWVVEWRKHPACKTAQPLRDLLLRVEQIDSDIINMIENENRDAEDNDTPVEWNYIRPQFTLTDRIAMKSWLLD